MLKKQFDFKFKDKTQMIKSTHSHSGKKKRCL